MKLKALSLLLTIALFFSANGHFVFLQGVAWGTMAKQFYSDTESLSSVLDKTFSGEFPCRICQSIEASMEAQDEGNKTSEISPKSLNHLIPFFPPPTSLVWAKGCPFSEEVLLLDESIPLVGSPPPRV
ncbi:MAG: hypothetical protein DF168_00169 [Candidatus Moanabacter tarae]|uniref:Uncharacterized protein n=1 Tax=Candidatus Moanibacter tarae TaxID=2200854 RepID=A0A2Z4AGE0_9BACT|nr:MAG: hypothetical protein DF168_00169 [Candidatus Moanabacter tarae]|tara:strand:- start:15652 stop:16035 length:384 start_codon:yes stop_codon:yes gene_type:complete